MFVLAERLAFERRAKRVRLQTLVGPAPYEASAPDAVGGGWRRVRVGVGAVHRSTQARPK